MTEHLPGARARAGTGTGTGTGAGARVRIGVGIIAIGIRRTRRRLRASRARGRGRRAGILDFPAGFAVMVVPFHQLLSFRLGSAALVTDPLWIGM